MVGEEESSEFWAAEQEQPFPPGIAAPTLPEVGRGIQNNSQQPSQKMSIRATATFSCSFLQKDQLLTGEKIETIVVVWLKIHTWGGRCSPSQVPQTFRPPAHEIPIKPTKVRLGK